MYEGQLWHKQGLDLIPRQASRAPTWKKLTYPKGLNDVIECHNLATRRRFFTIPYLEIH